MVWLKTQGRPPHQAMICPYGFNKGNLGAISCPIPLSHSRGQDKRGPSSEGSPWASRCVVISWLIPHS